MPTKKQPNKPAKSKISNSQVEAVAAMQRRIELLREFKNRPPGATPAQAVSTRLPAGAVKMLGDLAKADEVSQSLMVEILILQETIRRIQSFEK